jgi:benzylsuccinate CoA-transferase BbsF subunit
MNRLGFGYQDLRKLKADIVYVSNSGFGASGPYSSFKTFGPIVQACCGLTYTSGLPDLPPAGWGYSYMDHMGANFMALAVLAGLIERNRTGQGQWIDMSCTEAGLTLAGPELLDFTANGRSMRRPGQPDSNRTNYPAMVPHGIFATSEDDGWVAIACRDDSDWERLAQVVDEDWARAVEFRTFAGRANAVELIERRLGEWAARRSRHAAQDELRAGGVPAAKVSTPEDRIDHDPDTRDWGLWPTVGYRNGAAVRVDGIPAHLSETDWEISRPSPSLGEHNQYVFGDILGIDDEELSALEKDGVI